MLDKLIKDKVDLVSYSQQELFNIKSTLDNLKTIINHDPNFKAPFLGGSYRRATMVKGISDVDVYFQYIGTGNSQSALVALKNWLVSKYPTSIIKQDKPSILVDFNKIPINITPYKKDTNNNMSIPDNNLLHWQLINFGELESAIIALRQKNSKFIELIKILKLWNRSYNKEIRNYEIEKKVCNMFLYQHHSSQSISDWILFFFKSNGYQSDADKFYGLMNSNLNDSELKTVWLKFIDNK